MLRLSLKRVRKASAKVVRIFWWVGRGVGWEGAVVGGLGGRERVVVGRRGVVVLREGLDAVDDFALDFDFDLGVGVEVSRTRLPGVLGPGMLWLDFSCMCV